MLAPPEQGGDQSEQAECFRQRMNQGAAKMASIRKIMCFINVKASKPILLKPPNKNMNPKITLKLQKLKCLVLLEKMQYIVPVYLPPKPRKPKI